MMPLITRPFELLKLVRDGIITYVSDLRMVDPRSRYFVDGAIENLVRSGFVARSPDGRLSPTPRLRRTFAGLGVSLTQLAPFSSESVITAPVFGPPAAPVLKADVFVLMPFADELKPLYDGHIKPVAHKLGLTVARADDFFTASSVVSDVWNSIYAARVVIGDCTGRNAMVNDLVVRNVADLAAVPTGKPGRPSKSLNLEQALAVLDAAKGARLWPYVAVSMLGGIRTEEARALRWSQVDLEAGTVAVYRSVRRTG